MGYTDEGIGYQKRDTSLAAAESDKAGKITLREQVFNVIEQSPVPMSADEVAEELGKSFISIRPRVTELSNEARVKDSGLRGTTQHGKSCILWEVADDWLF